MAGVFVVSREMPVGSAIASSKSCWNAATKVNGTA